MKTAYVFNLVDNFYLVVTYYPYTQGFVFASRECSESSIETVCSELESTFLCNATPGDPKLLGRFKEILRIQRGRLNFGLIPKNDVDKILNLLAAQNAINIKWKNNTVA